MNLFAFLAPARARIGGLSENALGLALMALSTLSMTGMHVCIRLVPGGMHPFEMAFIRNAIGLLLLNALFARAGLTVFRTRRLGLHATRGFLNVIAMFAFFYGLPITPLAMVNALGFTGPLFASLLAIPLLGERLRAHRLAVIGIGVLGTLIILRPGIEAIHIGPVLILASSLAWSMALIAIKALSRTESSGTITMYMALFMTPLSLIGAAPFLEWPTLEQVGWLTLVAVLGTTAQVSLAQSFRMAEVTAVLPLDFLKLLWGSVFGFLFFAEIPDVMTWVGGTVIFLSTFYLALRERR
jgi:drug/metabolite transporter (DMT)-like permease